jgi:hypothetical protein
MPDCMRETTGHPLEVGEHPIATFAPQPVKRVRKKVIVVHDSSVSAMASPAAA